MEGLNVDLFKKKILEQLKKTEETKGKDIDEEARNESKKSDVGHLDERNYIYTDLLFSYAKQYKSIANFKITKYPVVFRCILASYMIVIGVFSIVVLVIMYYVTQNNFNFNAAFMLLTASASLSSTLLIIPTKIIDFIFDREDNKYILEIMKHIQKYDSKVRDSMK